MKYLITILSLLLISIGTIAGEQTDIITEKFQVSGNCSMCKKRIEKAAYIKGVKLAEWDKETKVLTVTYRKSKTSADAILKSIAAAGHDSEKFTANKDDYSKLPECCNYRTGACDH